MRYQDERAAKLQQAFLQNVQCRDVEIVGGFIEQENVGGLQHELSDQHSRPFAARKPAYRLI